ncbi:MAG: DUF805 domain-containing protein [Alphaproteobacteria bacterium]|nr:DUF805 domain-containing protein [Alphaproteobacteria bacterium]
MSDKTENPFFAIAGVLLSFKGRVSRTGYILLILFAVVMHQPYLAFRDVVAAGHHTPLQYMLAVASAFAYYLICASAHTRRLHDIGLRGWWIVAPLTVNKFIPEFEPFLFFTLALWIVPGRQAENIFGRKPPGFADMLVRARLARLERKYLSGAIDSDAYNAARADITTKKKKK